MTDIPAEILSKLLAIAGANGIDIGLAPEGSELPDDRPIFPAVSLNRAVSELAHETGLNLKTSGLYLFQKRLITVNAAGEEEEMDDVRFRSWIDQFQLNYYKRKKRSDDDDSPGVPIKATMKADVAKVLLRSDEFRRHLPEIRRIVPVRLPRLRYGDDVTDLVILPYGYCSETGVYTADTGIDYALDWDLEKATKYLLNLLGDFPFAADEGRSMSVQISMMLTLYCQLMFAARDRMPMGFFNANDVGSGKSRLAELCIYPVMGDAEGVGYAENDEFKKSLDTWAKSGKPYLLLDDVSGLVKNNDLNRWLTMAKWSGREMHTQRAFSELNLVLTLMTGNQATLSDDLGRRALVVDLWASETAADRQGNIKTVIDAEWLANAGNRGDILSALHALVMNWFHDHEAKEYHKLIPSFEGWSRVVPAIVTAAGYACPLQKPMIADAGAKQEVEFVRMLEKAVAEHNPQLNQPIELRLHKWAGIARRAGVFHGVISDMETQRDFLEANPKYYKAEFDADGIEFAGSLTSLQKENQAYEFLDKSASTKFGNLLHKFYRGKVREVNGARYKFADREARHSTFALEMIRAADAPTGQSAT